MTSPSGLALLGRAAGMRSRIVTQQPQAGDRGFDAGPRWMRAVPPLAALAVMLTGISVPSFWRDEAATLAAVRRPFGDLIRMLGQVDAVHGAYYVLTWAVVHVFGAGELAVRLPSVAATAVAAGFVAALGRRLVSPGAGLAAGVLFAVLPDISLYGQDARSYAMVTAMAAIASYLLVRAIQEPGRRAWWTSYGAALALLGTLNIFGLLLIPAHAATVAARCWRPRAGQSRRTLAVSWAVAAAAAAAAASPLLVLGWRQRGQISWLTIQGANGLISLQKLIGPPGMSIAVLVIVALGIGVSAAGGRSRLRAAWPPKLAALTLPWLVVPPAILLLGSLITPMYVFRYILFCIPAAALIGGAGLASLGRLAGPVGLAVVMVLGFQAQTFVRSPGGHGDNIRQADQLVAASRRPGDAVLFPNRNAESFGAAYPYGIGKLRNIATAVPAIPSATLAGTDVSARVIRQRLAAVGRLWVIEINKSAPVPLLHGLGLRLSWTWRTSDVWLRLYVRASSSPAPAPAGS